MGENRMRSFYCTDDLWDAATEAADVENAGKDDDDSDTTVSDIIRRGMRREIKLIHRRARRSAD